MIKKTPCCVVWIREVQVRLFFKSFSPFAFVVFIVSFRDNRLRLVVKLELLNEFAYSNCANFQLHFSVCVLVIARMRQKKKCIAYISSFEFVKLRVRHNISVQLCKHFNCSHPYMVIGVAIFDDFRFLCEWRRETQCRKNVHHNSSFKFQVSCTGKNSIWFTSDLTQLLTVVRFRSS